MMAFKSVFALAVLLLTATPGSAHVPRGNPPGGGREHRGFPRAGRHPQAIQSIEFNGITVLHEDLLHSMSPVQEKLDITRTGISVAVRFQFDEMMMQPMGKPQSHGSITIVHNQTEQEVVRMPLMYDASSRSELRGELRMTQETRRTIKKKCPDTTCVAQISVNNRFFGRSTVIELGKLKVHKKSNGKTSIKLLTYPRLIDTTNKDFSWANYGLTWSAAFHFFLLLGAMLMLLVGIEAWRAQGVLPKGEDTSASSKRWLQLALVCSLLYLGMSGGRALDFVAMKDIVYAAPVAAILGLFSFCFAGGPIDEEDDVVDTQDEDYMGEDEEDTQSEGPEESKKTI